MQEPTARSAPFVNSATGNALLQRCLLLAMVLGSGCVLALSLTPTNFALTHFVADDMFYYLTAAKHIAEGRPPSVDGVSRTNGYHPLWMGICVLIQLLFGHRVDLVFHIALGLCGIFFVATGWLLAFAIRHVAGNLSGLIFGTLFLCNYRMATIALSGLETALYGLMIAIFTVWFVRLGRFGLQSPKDAIILGLLLGAIYASRLDGLLFGVCVCAGLVFLFKRSTFQHRVRMSLLAGAVSLVALIPWFVISLRSVGALLPRSGVALQVANGFESQQGQTITFKLLGFLRFTAANNIGPLNDLASTLAIWPLIPSPQDFLRYLGPVALLCLAIAIVLLIQRTYRIPALLAFQWIPVYALLQTLYYAAFGSLQPRYLYPAILLMALYVSAALYFLPERFKSTNFLRSATLSAAALMLVIALVSGASAFRLEYGVSRFQALHLGLRGLADWLHANTDPNAVIGGFNTGITGYYSGRTVVNLDGVMNDSAITALQDRKLQQLISSANIHYLADVGGEIEKFMERFSGDPDWRTYWVEVHQTTIPYGKGVVPFLVLRKREPSI